MRISRWRRHGVPLMATPIVLASLLISANSGFASTAKAPDSSQVVPVRTVSQAAAPMPSRVKEYLEYDRPAKYSTIRTEIQVPTRDGTKIGCTMWRPAKKGTNTPAPGRFPGVIVAYLPYFLIGVQGAGELVLGASNYFSNRGYVTLMCWPRGTGTSEGEWGGWFTAQENRDNYDIIEWLARQPFSTGKVGQTGGSYGGMTSYRVARLNPPHLEAIAPIEAYSSIYDNYTYPGGIRSTNEPVWITGGGVVYGAGRPHPYPQAVDWLRHPLLDDYWKQIDIAPHYDQMKVPVLNVGGWRDLFQDGTPRNYIGLKSRGALIMGPWNHGDAALPLNPVLAWFDHYVMRLRSAPRPPSQVLSYQMPNGPWRTHADWPPRNAHNRTRALNGDGTLGAAEGAGTSSYTADTTGGVTPPVEGLNSLSFTSDPASRNTDIAGAGEARLVATLTDPTGVLGSAASQVDTNFVLYVHDVAPDGTELYVTKGYMKASHRRSHSYQTIIDLGKPAEYRIPLWHIDWRLAKGHRLRLQLTAGDHARDNGAGVSAAPAPLQPIPPLRVGIAVGKGGSSLTLPIRR